MKMEIRHLQTFVTIAELGSFTKAAEYLGYAQSTITSHIQILENELGEILFNRLGKKIILTNLGKELIPYAKQMLEVYKEILENLGFSDLNLDYEVPINDASEIRVEEYLKANKISKFVAINFFGASKRRKFKVS